MSKQWLWLIIGVVMLSMVCAAGGGAKTIYSDGWVPPRLVEGVWVSAGVSDEVAKEEAAICNKGKTRDEVRQSEWDVCWRWYWDEEGAPEWAVQRGEREQRQWERYYANQQRGGLTGLGQYGQPSSRSTQLLGYSSDGGSSGYSSGGSSSRCGSPTKTTGAPCRNLVSGGGYCYLHR